MGDPAADSKRRALWRAKRKRELEATALGRLQCVLSSLRSLLLPLGSAIFVALWQEANPLWLVHAG